MNKTLLMGRLTKDPELRYTQSGIAVARFTLAVDRRMQKDKTDFISVVAWRKLAEFCAQYLSKGSKVVIVGSLQTRAWDDKETGKRRSATEVVADEMYFAESKRTGAQEEKNPLEEALEDGSFTLVEDEDLPF